MGNCHKFIEAKFNGIIPSCRWITVVYSLNHFVRTNIIPVMICLDMERNDTPNTWLYHFKFVLGIKYHIISCEYMTTATA